MPTILYDTIQIPLTYKRRVTDSIKDPNTETLTLADVVPYIPGACWIQLIRVVHEEGRDAAINFVIHLTETEIARYRKTMYICADSQDEPNDLFRLFDQSTLRALLNYIRDQAKTKNEVNLAVNCLRCIAHKFCLPIPPFNWSFLTEFIHNKNLFADASPDHQFDMQKYALTIAVNQMAHSTSAKSIVENYLDSFNAKNIEFEEIRPLLQLVPALCDAVSKHVLERFLEHVLSVQYKLSTNFITSYQVVPFELAIMEIIPIFERECLVPENVDVVVKEMIKYHMIIEADHNSGVSLVDKYINQNAGYTKRTLFFTCFFSFTADI